jgi:hypothetical protein
MRMYNAEWEALKRLDYTPNSPTFNSTSGMEIPADHGYALFEEIARHLPWLRDHAQAGIHPVHGAPSGRNDNLVINRRVKLVLRLPVDHCRCTRTGRQGNRSGRRKDRHRRLERKSGDAICDAVFTFCCCRMTRMKPFLNEDRADADEIGIEAGSFPASRHQMHIPKRVIGGYSLMLHDIDLMQSMILQERGLGLHRGYGCGIFIPHKSIKEVAID